MKIALFLKTTVLFTLMCCQQIYAPLWVSSRTQDIVFGTEKDADRKAEQYSSWEQKFSQCKEKGDDLRSGGDASRGITGDSISLCMKTIVLDECNKLEIKRQGI